MDNETFIKRLSVRVGYDAVETGRLVGTMASTLATVTSEVDSVAIPGFGTFQPIKEDERIETEPSGKRMLLPPSISLVFKESVVLRKKLKNS